jgi:signal transduction histidine kinase
MRGTQFRYLSAPGRLALLAAAAVLLPTAILVTLQYRQSRELQKKTQAAVKETLRETLIDINKKTDEEMGRLSDQAFQPISKSTLSPIDSSKLKEHFVAFTRAHPEVAELFVVPTCTVAGKQPPVHVFTSGQWREFAQTDQNAKQLLAIFNRAQAAGDSNPGHSKLVYWQQSCNCEKRPPIYVFRSVSDGFLGMTLNFDYVQKHYLAKLLADTAASKSAGDSGQLVIAALGEDKKEMFTTGKAPAQYDVSIGFGPVFPRWQLAAGYSGATIAELAQRNFETNLLLDGLTVALLLAGILLTLRAATREVKLAQAKSSFVSNVSHELKTPLSLIRLFAEILELGRTTSKEQEHDYHRIIHRESRRLTQLINNILDFSKIEAGRKQYQFTSCDIGSIVEDVLSTYEYQITSSGFDLETHIEPGLPPAQVDPEAIAQALLNLLSNAVKYSRDVKKVEVRVESRGGQIAIEVADHGIGIPESEHQRIFEKFYRVGNDLVHTARGTGLGLALVKHIMDAHRGKIVVDSTAGKGSRFTILLQVDPFAVASSPNESTREGYAIAHSPNR